MTTYIQRRPYKVDLLSPRVWKSTHVNAAYEVSDCGQIRNVLTGKLLRLSLNINTKRNDRRFCVNVGEGKRSVTGNRTRLHYNVHVLVCWAFHGPPPSPLHEVAHNNGDPRDNRVDNLRWSTHADNIADKHIHGTYNPPPVMLGEEHGMSRLTVDSVHKMRELAESGMSHRKIAGIFNVDKSTAGRVIKRQTWKHVQ